MKAKHMNALLVEIMMAVLFFALSAAVILELFAAGHNLNRQAEVLGSAAVHAQTISEQLYAAEDMPALLKGQGFEYVENSWAKDFEDYEIQVRLDAENTGAGEMQHAQIYALNGEETLVNLPCVRYVSGEVTP